MKVNLFCAFIALATSVGFHLPDQTPPVRTYGIIQDLGNGHFEVTSTPSTNPNCIWENGVCTVSSLHPPTYINGKWVLPDTNPTTDGIYMGEN